MKPAAVLLLALALAAAHRRPARGPDAVGNPQQLTSYLEELQKYYTVYGRGRYGKRFDNSIPYKEIPVYHPYPVDDQDRWKSVNDI